MPLLLDGVYVDSPAGLRFRWVEAPSSAELRQLTHTIAHRVSRFLEKLAPRAQRVLWVRQGLLVRDDESAQLTLTSRPVSIGKLIIMRRPGANRQ